MSGDMEIGKCDFCKQHKPKRRTYFYPSKYEKEPGAFINKTLHNEGDYFAIIYTCIDCGDPLTYDQLKNK